MDAVSPDTPKSFSHIPMKLRACLFVILAFLSGTTALTAQTLDWGNDVFGDVVDSTGAPLDATFIFELGAFDAGFTPDESNVNDWIANWNVFDRAGFNASAGYFASSVRMLPDGRSDSPYLTEDSGSFEGLNAYLFVRNSDLPVPLTEWLLVRAPDWIFPVADDCCPGQLSIEWALSDVDGTPVFGSVEGDPGAGVVGVPGVHDLQTYTFVPEPGTALLAALGLLFAISRRQRI
jgi:hypothetical protein